MARLVFEDPPERASSTAGHGYTANKNGDRRELVQRLRKYPGRWAIVSRHSSRSRAAYITRALRVEYGQLGYEFQTARKPDGQGVVYGRYSSADVNIE